MRTDEILSLQKRRIKKLEKELARQKSRYEALKWELPRSKKSNSYQTLVQHMKKRDWVLALKEANKLEKKGLGGVKLFRYRQKIFSEMGLKTQATREGLRYQTALKKREKRKVRQQ